MEIVLSPIVYRNLCDHFNSKKRLYPSSVDILWCQFTDGSDNPKGKIYRLSMSYTEVGSDPSMAIKVSTRVYGDVIVTTITRFCSFIGIFGVKIFFF